MSSPLRRPWPASFPVPPGSSLLVLATVAGFGLAAAVPGSVRSLALVPAELAQRPWSALTYAFVQTVPYVLGLNLAVLLLVAPRLEQRVGALRLAGYYLAGAAVGLLLALADPRGPTAGSGPAVFGLVVGLARHAGDEPIIPPVRLPNRLLLVVLGAAVLLAPLSEVPSPTLRWVLLGSLILGLLRFGRPPKRGGGSRRVEAPNSHFNPPGVSHGPAATPWDSIDLESLHEVNRAVVETLLERARALGPDHLTPSERELLDRMASAARLALEYRR